MDSLLSTMANFMLLEKVGFYESGSLVIFRLVVGSSLSEAWALAFLDCLLKVLAISGGEWMKVESIFHGYLTGLNPFREYCMVT